MFDIYRGEVLRACVVLCERRHVERQLRITRRLFKLNGNAMDKTPLEGILMRADDSLRSAMASAGNNTWRGVTGRLDGDQEKIKG